MSDLKDRNGIKYAVVPVSTVRALNIRTNDEVIDAQAVVDDEMIAALEDMINSAKAGKLKSKTALAAGAVAW